MKEVALFLSFWFFPAGLLLGLQSKPIKYHTQIASIATFIHMYQLVTPHIHMY
jgi:hypothetical protein